MCGADGNGAHAEGVYSFADGTAAHAEGQFTSADGDYSHAAGFYAYADHDNSFVWADYAMTAFRSTTNNQFNVRATHGVRLETSGAGCTVDGYQVAKLAYIPQQGDLMMGSYTNGVPE